LARAAPPYVGELAHGLEGLCASRPRPGGASADLPRAQRREAMGNCAGSKSQPLQRDSLRSRTAEALTPFGGVNSLLFYGREHFHFREEHNSAKQRPSAGSDTSETSDEHDERTLDMVSGMRHFGNQYLWQLRSAASDADGDRSKIAVDLLMFGEFGRDLDKEKAVCVAVSMQRMGLVGHISLVASGNGAPERARLALGTANLLRAECSAAVGHGGSPQDEVFPFEFDHCDYLAEEAELDPAGGHELVFSAICRAVRKGRQICIVVAHRHGRSAAGHQVVRGERGGVLRRDLRGRHPAEGERQAGHGPRSWEQRLRPQGRQGGVQQAPVERVATFLRSQPARCRTVPAPTSRTSWLASPRGTAFSARQQGHCAFHLAASEQVDG